jgi:tRNA A-37 threonylcarbamoyl transferase component Bud32
VTGHNSSVNTDASMLNTKKIAKLQAITYRTVPGVNFRLKLREFDQSSQNTLHLLLMFLGAGGIMACCFVPYMSLFCFPMLILLASLALVCVSSDMISIGERGVAFPITSCISLCGRTIRLWSDVESVEIISANGNLETPIQKNGSAVHLMFKSGGTLTLPLKNFTRESIGSFVSALQEWGHEGSQVDRQLEHVPRLWDLENGDLSELKELSYTKFWEEELANNYSFTAFVPLQVGQKLRNETITVIKQIAAGGFSAIYTVKDLDGGLFVLKESVIPSTTDEKTKDKAKEHFKREAEILIKLDHPNIAKVVDHFVDTARDYLLLQYIEGPDARELARRSGKQPVGTVLHWAAQMCDVLQYLHTQNPPVVHRDISPDNIVIDKSGNAVLIDFGAANEFVGEATGTLVGKQAYMSPEQIRGKVTPQSDIYSLGATIYFMLTGKDPEPLTSSRPRKIDDSISVQLDDLINECTKLDLLERIKDASALKERLQSLGKEKVAAAIGMDRGREDV